MDIKKVYISGAISGLPIQAVIAKFQAAEEKLRRFGLEPINPLYNGLPVEAEWAEHVGKDVGMLLKCDAVYLLPDGKQSRGSRIEVAVARVQQMPLFVDASADVAEYPVDTYTRLEL
jgi:hypothetical protein